MDNSLSTHRCFRPFKRLLSILVANIFLSAMSNPYHKNEVYAKKV